MAITVNSGLGIYQPGTPLPGVMADNYPNTFVVSGYAAETIPFGRIVSDFSIDADGTTKSFNQISDVSTSAGGASKLSYDAIAQKDDLKYSPTEAIGVMQSGIIVLECAEDLALDGTALTVINGAGSGDEDNIGKIAQTTGAGYSETTNLRLFRKISATLAEVEILGPITLVAGS